MRFFVKNYFRLFSIIFYFTFFYSLIIMAESKAKKNVAQITCPASDAAHAGRMTRRHKRPEGIRLC